MAIVGGDACICIPPTKIFWGGRVPPVPPIIAAPGQANAWLEKLEMPVGQLAIRGPVLATVDALSCSAATVPAAYTAYRCKNTVLALYGHTFSEKTPHPKTMFVAKQYDQLF